MKDYRYALSLTSQFYFCGLPFRLDIGPNCSSGCKYCFSNYHSARYSSRPALLDVERLGKKIESALSSNKYKDIVSEFIRRNMPIHLGGLSDPFMNSVTTEKVFQILELFNEYNYPIIISTKNGLIRKNKKLLGMLCKMKYISFQVSIATPSEYYTKKLEPNASLLEDRYELLKILEKEGVHTTIRFQPIIIPLFQRFSSVFLEQIISSRCKHVILEFLKIPNFGKGVYFNYIYKLLSWDGFEYYKKMNSLRIGHELILPPGIKWELLQKFVEELKDSSLSVGIADYGLYHMGSTSCCCGIDNLDGFGNWFKENIPNVINNSHKSKVVLPLNKMSLIPGASIKMYINSDSRLESKNTLKDCLIDRWNKFNSPYSPSCYLGIRQSNKIDGNGNLIYSKI